MTDLAAAFDGDPALVAYVVAGDPSVEATKEHVRALVRGGADVVELGLPFSEPIAEGPTIQRGVRRALDAGMTTDRYFDLVADLDVDVPVVCMTYYNLVFHRGVETFAAEAADAGVSGLVVPDLPAEESGPLREACERHGLDLVFMVAPTTAADRLAATLDRASGFLYVQARLGTTGARDDVSGQTHASLDRLADADVPKAVGFGIATGEQAREVVAGGADGVIVGSAFVDIVADRSADDADADDANDADGESVPARLEATARELKAGAREGLPEPERT